MTAGTAAMREAARLEAARFYGLPVGDSSIASRRTQRADDERQLADALTRATITARVEAGASIPDLMHLYGLTRDEARGEYARAVDRSEVA